TSGWAARYDIFAVTRGRRWKPSPDRRSISVPHSTPSSARKAGSPLLSAFRPGAARSPLPVRWTSRISSGTRRSSASATCFDGMPGRMEWMRLRSERSLTDEPDPSLLDVALGESHQLVDEMHRGHGRVGGVFVRHRIDHLGRSLVALENPD